MSAAFILPWVVSAGSGRGEKNKPADHDTLWFQTLVNIKTALLYDLV